MNCILAPHLTQNICSQKLFLFAHILIGVPELSDCSHCVLFHRCGKLFVFVALLELLKEFVLLFDLFLCLLARNEQVIALSVQIGSHGLLKIGLEFPLLIHMRECRTTSRSIFIFTIAVRPRTLIGLLENMFTKHILQIHRLLVLFAALLLGRRGVIVCGARLFGVPSTNRSTVEEVHILVVETRILFADHRDDLQEAIVHSRGEQLCVLVL
mmetsp:Transcript_31921/g.80048  ORF Transcript_31921/g.80048 Transcript_31921/m.80048 type:complete len:212 (-) Transcript_31921:344-979(-)